MIGTTSDCPIRVGQTTRDTILLRFGKPTYSSQHDLAWGYLFRAKTGTYTGLSGGPCGPSYGTRDVTEWDDVWLVFDAGGVLRRAEKHRIGTTEDVDQVWRVFAATVPDPVRLDQLVDQHP